MNNILAMILNDILAMILNDILAMILNDIFKSSEDNYFWRIHLWIYFFEYKIETVSSIYFTENYE